MAKPNKKGPSRTVEIICSQCNGKLFKYRKGGKGSLIKCFKERIVEDFTNEPCHCPHCQQCFARETLVRGVPAYKVIGDKARLK